MKDVTVAQFEAWLATRPPSVQALGKEFPIGTLIQDSQGELHVVGYTEDDHLIVSRLDPFVDYDAATDENNTLYVHGKCAREAIARASHVQPE